MDSSYLWRCSVIMVEVCDSGKIWCKGSTQPIHAVRVDIKIFATGKEENQIIKCWVNGDVLCVDLHESGIRTARKFPLDLEPTLSGTVLNVMSHTKHADVSIVSSNQNGVEEKIVSGETYRVGQYDSMESGEFWDKVWDL